MMKVLLFSVLFNTITGWEAKNLNKCFINKIFIHRLSFAEIIDQELEHGEKAQQFVEQMMRDGYEVGIIQEALCF